MSIGLIAIASSCEQVTGIAIVRPNESHETGYYLELESGSFAYLSLTEALREAAEMGISHYRVKGDICTPKNPYYT